jgi:hypothetical protein
VESILMANTTFMETWTELDHRREAERAISAQKATPFQSTRIRGVAMFCYEQLGGMRVFLEG